MPEAIMEAAEDRPIPLDSKEGLDIYRHSTSHVMAYAVQQLFEDVKITIGPSIEDGFYYDFDVPEPFVPEDFEKIEEKMKEIISADLPFTREEMSRDEAIKLFGDMGETYKVELLEEMGDETVSVYRTGEFVDLCRGPHLPSTSHIKAFKLLSVAGAYWRGDEKNQMLSRIYGTAFPTEKLVRKYLALREEALKRDHRKLGKELDLFSVNEEIGPGLILWHPRGAIIRILMENFWREEHLKAGYEIVFTPHIAKAELWQTSGHTGFYADSMFSPMDVDEKEFLVKPMNCPFHIKIFQSRLRSFRELPIRWAELGTVYRYERSGVLHGLLRVRGFTQDDAHLFCRPDQLEDELTEVLRFSLYMLKSFGFSEYEIYLSTRPDKFVGSEEGWEESTKALEKALAAVDADFEIDPGEGVFYGPKIDIKIKDSLGRAWQCSTIQVDFNMPERFGLSYVGTDGAPHRPIMIHRALMGSLERFFGCLVEHYGGAFPTWLAPVQVILLPITDRSMSFCEEIRKACLEKGIRIEIDSRNEKLGLKIREAEIRKIPYMAIIGDREVSSGMISPRTYREGSLEPMTAEGFLDMILKDASTKGAPSD